VETERCVIQCRVLRQGETDRWAIVFCVERRESLSGGLKYCVLSDGRG